MPLEHGPSKEAFSNNVRELMNAGHSQQQSLAVAYKEKETTDAADGTVKAAGVMYIDDNSVLLVKRLDGSWAFPGGKVEMGETTQQAACRESVEEVGFKPDPDVMWQIDYSNNGRVQFTTYCARVGFEPILNTDEHSEYRWFDFGELPDVMHPNALKTLEKYTRTYMGVGLDSARQVDVNGWIEIKDNPISKAGIFEYYGRQIDKSLEPNKVYRVLRSPEELSRKETIESFKLVPFIDEHVMLGPPESGMVAPERKGIEGVTGQEVYFDMATGKLKSNIKVFSTNLDALIAGGKRELSLGYRCKYKISAGVFEGQPYDVEQYDIRGNHLALVKQGRMGPDVAVLDHMNFTFDAKDCTMPETEKKSETGLDEAKVGEMIGKAVDAALKAMDEKMEERFKKSEDAKGKDEDDKKSEDEDKDDKKGEDKKGMDEAIKSAMDAALAPILESINELKSAGTKSVITEVRRRDELARQLGTFGIAVDNADDMTLPELRAAAVKQIGITCAEGQETVALDGYFHNRTAPGNEVGYALDHRKTDDKKGTNAAKDFYAKAADAA